MDAKNKNYPFFPLNWPDSMALWVASAQQPGILEEILPKIKGGAPEWFKQKPCQKR